MKVYMPASYAELRAMLAQALEQDGPAALCYPRGGEGDYKEDRAAMDESILRSGSYGTIVCCGIMVNEALKAARILESKGFSVEVIKLGRIDPDSFPMVMASAARTGRLVMAEESAARGCVGNDILAQLQSAGIVCRSKLLNLGSGVVEHGSVAQLRHKYGIDAEAIAAALEEKK